MEMKAIVLSYDKNHPICELMYKKYMELWPDCPLTFRIPWNQTAPAFFKNKSNVELIQCDKSIRLTVEALLDNIDDDEWVYWCIDDRVPVYINTVKINAFHKNVTMLKEFDFAKAFNHRYIATKCGDRKGITVPLPTSKDISKDLVMQENGQQYGFYNHHYCRARILKSIYTQKSFPGIDGFHKRYIANGPSGEKTCGTLKHLKGAMIRGEKSLIDFLEPCVDGKITPEGLTHLSEMNIEHNYGK